MQAWRDGDHELVDHAIRADYARSERAVERLHADPEAMKEIDLKITELRRAAIGSSVPNGTPLRKNPVE